MFLILIIQKKKYKKKIKYDPSNEIIKENEKLIIDNNEDFVAINKNAGISVQGGTKSKKNLIDIFSKSKIFNKIKPYTVHRLDKETSGVFIIAKHRESAQLLTSLFRLRKVYKTYIAICHGELPINEGVWKNDLIRYDREKKITEKAETIFKVLDKNSICSLVQMKPITGRKHQLRKQLLIHGHPILGDSKYRISDNYQNKKNNLMLHAYKINFTISGIKYNFFAGLPFNFQNTLKEKYLRTFQ